MGLLDGHLVELQRACRARGQGKRGDRFPIEQPEMNLPTGLEHHRLRVGEDLDVVGFEQEICLQPRLVQVIERPAILRVEGDEVQGLQSFGHGIRGGSSDFSLLLQRGDPDCRESDPDGWTSDVRVWTQRLDFLTY